MSKTTMSLLALGAALALTACGDSYEAVDQNHSGNLAEGATEHDGRNCDSYEVSVGEGWTVTADMTSEWDNYLYLAKDGTDVTSNDDTNGTNARISHTITEAGTHTVFACSYAGDTGAYQLHIVTAAGN